MTSTTTPPAPIDNNYASAAEMTKHLDAAYITLRDAAQTGKAKDGATAYKDLASKAIAAGLNATNKTYTGRLFRSLGVFKGIDDLLLKLEANKETLDPE